MGQLPLDLTFPPRYGAEDFLVATSNGTAFDTLMSWPGWPASVLLLVGPAGSGKTHLASIWAARARARMLSGADLAGLKPADIAGAHAVIDDADGIAGKDVEATLFHTLNFAREHRRSVLLTASGAPDRWDVRTPDLLSRLRAAPSVRLAAPEDELVRAVLVKLFLDRQLDVDHAVIDFIALRMERSLAAARDLVARLDQASLAEGRRITRPVAAQVLAAPDA